MQSTFKAGLSCYKCCWGYGFSFYIEVDGKKILFDTRKSGDFIKNANSLNISLHDLDFCIISHGHYDHSGGFEMWYVGKVARASFVINIAVVIANLLEKYKIGG